MPPVVYLDTQDYSRFGDVLRGKGNRTTEALFKDLETRHVNGDVIFALSMPILGELLQYDPSFRDTSLRKAEAVERFCGTYALPYPSRLIAIEIAQMAKARGLIESSIPPVLSTERYWYPNIGDAFEGFGRKMQDELKTRVDALPLSARARRRGAKALAKKADLRNVVRKAAPEIAEKFGLPLEAITDSVVALMRGDITSAEASKRLFTSIAEPSVFVETYFERTKTDRTLPDWISGAGRGFHDALSRLRVTLEPTFHIDFTREQVRQILAAQAQSFRVMVLKVASDDTEEFGITADVLARIESDNDLVAEVPACDVMSAVVGAYILQILGFAGSEAKIETSFAGDLIHAIYLPHVDLWRGGSTVFIHNEVFTPAFRRPCCAHIDAIAVCD